ncbi:MAG: FtsX-like permease family protein [Chloroflexi bacterium]|nr:FtsX-like permease family protein [Chloroflexota bacterium]
MFARILLKSLKNRRSRVLVAILAVLLGASLVAALTSLSLDTGSKAGKELRAYGANITLTPKAAMAETGLGGMEFGDVKEERYLSERDLAVLQTGETGQDIVNYAPYLHGIVEAQGQRLVLAGVWFDRVQQISPWWKVTGQWAVNNDPSATMIGVNAAARLKLQPGDKLSMRSGPNAKDLVVKGLVETGGQEDNQVFVPLVTAQSLLDKPGRVGAVQISAMVNRRPLENIASDIEKRIPGSAAKPVGQIAEAEATILDKIRLLMGLVAVLVLIAAGLAVGSTMTTSVLERTKEIGLMKSLGARKQRIAAIFLGEAAAVGLLGGVLGYGIGMVLAQLIGWTVFGSSVSPRWLAIPATLGIALAVALLASIIPVRRAVSIDPIFTLRGE